MASCYTSLQRGIFLLFFVIVTSALSAQTPVVVDNTENFTGVFNSLSVINGQPAIAYRSGGGSTSPQLRYAYRNGSNWVVESVASPQNGIDEYLSLAEINGQAGISFNTSGSSDLFYARRTGTWGIQLVEGGNNFTGNSSSLAQVNGQPAISYIDRTNSVWVLKYARFDGTSWGIQSIENTGNSTVFGTSLAVVGGQPAISYYPAFGGGTLKYARFNGASWDIQPVYSGRGRQNSMAVINGQPAIAFYDSQNPSVKYASFDGTSWSIQTVDGVISGAPISGGSRVSLAEISGQPAISYWSGNEIRYARWDGSQWVIQSLESGSGPGSSLTEVNGEAGISYYFNNSLKYIQIPQPPELQLLNSEGAPAVCGYDQPFFYAAPGATKSRTITLRNDGEGPLQVTALNFSDPVFSSPAALPFSISPGGSRALSLNFSPTAPQAYTGQMTIVSNDPDNPNCVINLSGTADPADIPTMSQWAFFLFGLTLFSVFVVGLYNVKRVRGLSACRRMEG